MHTLLELPVVFFAMLIGYRIICAMIGFPVGINVNINIQVPPPIEGE